MKITVTCQKCGKSLKAPPSLAGKRAKCSGCGAVLQIPTLDSAETGYELQVIDDKPKPAPRGKAPAPKAPAKNDGGPPPPLMLSDDLLEPELPVSALVEHNPSDSPVRGAGRGRGKAAAAAQDTPGRPMSAWERAAAKNSREATGPQPIFSLMGVDFTPIKTVVLVLFLLVFGGGGAWWFTGPGKGIRVVEASAVTRIVVLDNLVREPNKGMNVPLAMQAAKPTNPNPGIFGKKYQDVVLNIGGGERLIITRNDPNGDHIFVHVKLSQRVASEEGMENRYDMQFANSNFTLKVGQQTLTPIMMMSQLETTTLNLPIGSSPAHNYTQMVPAQVMPDEFKVDKGTPDDLASGTLIFNGSKGVQGQVEFQSRKRLYDYPGVSGVLGTGQLIQQDPYTGTALKYDYQGGDMTLQWNTPGRAWWSADQYITAPAVSPFARFDIYLLYERPETNEPMVLMCNSRVVATLSSSLAGKAGQQPPTVAVMAVPGGGAGASGTSIFATAPTPAPAPNASTASSTPGGTASIPGKSSAQAEAVASGPAAAPPKQAARGTFDYFGALARARQMGQGIIADNNMKQLGMGVLMYAEQNNGKLPASLDEIRPILGDINNLLINARTGDNPGYIYIQPARHTDDIGNPAGTPILYELKQGKLDRQGAIMYLDGHIELPKN